MGLGIRPHIRRNQLRGRGQCAVGGARALPQEGGAGPLGNVTKGVSNIQCDPRFILSLNFLFFSPSLLQIRNSGMEREKGNWSLVENGGSDGYWRQTFGLRPADTTSILA